MAVSSYWIKRAEADMLLYQSAADARLWAVGRAMHSAQAYLADEAKRIFHTYANRFNLTDEAAKAALAEPLNRAEYDRLVAKIATLPDGAVKTALEIRANSGAYAYRITRAEALKENIAIETARAYTVLEDELTGQLKFTAVEGYGRRMYGLQQQTGAFAVPNIRGLKIAINSTWAGSHYSARIWGARDQLAKELQEIVSSGFLSGESNAKIAAKIRDAFGVSFRDAERLVRTETSYIAGQADLQAYTDAEIETYECIETLDSRTCKICGGMDGKVFPVSQAVVGKNYPPFHPNCRGTTGAADHGVNGQRRGKDTNGKNVLLPADMTYAEWQDWQRAGAPADVWGWRNTLKNRGVHDIIDVEIDEMTPCLRKLSTGEIVLTHVEQINPATSDLEDFSFDWDKPARNGHSVYALYAQGDSRIQGLIALGDTGSDGGLWVELVENARFNSRYYSQGQQEYSGVGGHLFAEAIRNARMNNPNGYVYFQAKSGLVEYYEKAFGAELVVAKTRTMGIFDTAATKLLNRYYGGDWGE